MFDVLCVMATLIVGLRWAQAKPQNKSALVIEWRLPRVKISIVCKSSIIFVAELLYDGLSVDINKPTYESRFFVYLFF